MAGAPPVTLYSMPISHYCVSAERMLAFKGIGYERIRARYDDREALLKRSGQDYIPSMFWGERFVPWDQIPQVLEDQVPLPALFPEGRRALAEVLANWAHQVVEERVWRTVVTRIPPALLDDRERWVFEEMQSRARGPFSGLRSREPEFREELARYLGQIEGLLAPAPWVLGPPSVADFALFGALAPLAVAGEPVPERFPKIRDWQRRIAALGDPPPFASVA